MLLAYIDEIGEPGAFVSRDHARYKTSAAFGYAGFILPDWSARLFGQTFTNEKRTAFKTEVGAAPNPGAWEKKGSDIFRAKMKPEYAYQLRVVNGLVGALRARKGHLFYYAAEKNRGTPKQVTISVEERRMNALRQTVNRLARYADKKQENLLVMMDSVQEKERRDNVQQMYAHIFSRSASHREMARVSEPPMHIDSALSSNIQFADWIASLVGRAIDYQLIHDSAFDWVASGSHFPNVFRSFTYESKLDLWQRSVPHLHHSEVFHRERPLYPTVTGQALGSAVSDDRIAKMQAIALASSQ
ncbi:DUF3800 domain-containing protein [Nesterenkonia sp. E16_7]|uniref:DUF3800 domain-containing protein n=1 Tax=unclassified Nesterenkonia TaxID=2629769 RepID=UPI001A91186D|nr:MULTISPECIES: DUF3800 domain-containing protein [unclassified Nesterenkonia]MBO0594093.1 DUF3800 domain-containing protein [Nesterenkonia sp. E16_10]MBO0597539.1 DUF3800 domain-containing protein [Nesterenkonia sp. E16_7]